MQEHILKGVLKRIKEDDRSIVYNLELPIRGIHGSIYIDRSLSPVFDKLILTKVSNGSREQIS